MSNFTKPDGAWVSTQGRTRIGQEGISTTLSIASNPTLKRKCSRRVQASHEALYQPKAEEELVKEGTNTTLSFASNPTLKRKCSRRVQASHEALYQPKAEEELVKEGTNTTWSTVATQGWTGSGPGGNYHHTKHDQKSKGNTIIDGLQQIEPSLTNLGCEQQ